MGSFVPPYATNMAMASKARDMFNLPEFRKRMASLHIGLYAKNAIANRLIAPSIPMQA